MKSVPGLSNSKDGTGELAVESIHRATDTRRSSGPNVVDAQSR